MSGRYAVILADPPWPFATRSAKGKGRSAEAHYDCLSLHDIAALRVADFAADDCSLFLWATNPLLPAALHTMRMWDFSYRTVGFCWAKRTPADTGWHMGLGYHTRANVELCLLGIRGRPRRLARDVRQLVVAPRRQHSRKPAEVRAGIERLFAGPYLELFARETAPGWSTALSDQAGLLDAGPVSTRRWASDLAPEAAA